MRTSNEHIEIVPGDSSYLRSLNSYTSIRTSLNERINIYEIGYPL